MGIERKQVGEPYHYRGYVITAKFLGPDLLCCIDGVEFPNFYLDAAAVRCAGVRYIDLKIKEQEQRDKKS